jgi:hypothetical protein
MSDYATIEQIQALADEPDSTASPDAWELIAGSASRLFDKLVEVPDDFFAVAGDTATARTFYGDGTAYLQLAPFVATPTPVVDIPGGEYTVEADDFTVKDGKLIFLNLTRRMSDTQYPPYDRFTGWHDAVAVEVTAKWGFSEIPKDVTYAVCQIALWLWRQREEAVAITANLEGITAKELPVSAQTVVDKYREIYSQRALFA